MPKAFAEQFERVPCLQKCAGGKATSSAGALAAQNNMVGGMTLDVLEKALLRGSEHQGTTEHRMVGFVVGHLLHVDACHSLPLSLSFPLLSFWLNHRSMREEKRTKPAWAG